MSNKTTTYVGLGFLIMAPLGYYLYRDTVYNFIKGSFRGNLRQFPGRGIESSKRSNPEETHGNLDQAPERKQF